MTGEFQGDRPGAGPLTADWARDVETCAAVRGLVSGLRAPGRAWPRLSILVPKLPEARLLDRFVQAIRAQYYPNAEVLFLDPLAGASDAVLDLAPEIALRTLDGTGRPAIVLDAAMRAATGEVALLLGVDEVLAPMALFHIALARAEGNGALFSGQVGLCDGQGACHEVMIDQDGAAARGLSGRAFSRVLHERVGGFVGLDPSGETEPDLWSRLRQSGGKVRHLDLPLVLSAGDEAAGDIPGIAPRPRRIALINDLGYVGGAGIGHRRIATALAALGCELRAFRLADPEAADAAHGADHEDLAAELIDFAPDAIVLGNLHGAEADHRWLRHLLRKTPVLFVTHDYYWLTGRCAYPGGCTRNLTKACDESCPTYFEYPQLRPAEIAPALNAKMDLLAEPNAFVLTNSRVAAERVRDVLTGWGMDDALPRVQTAALGIEEALFRPALQEARQDLRARFGLPPGKALVLMPAGTYRDERKNARAAFRLLAQLPPERFHGVILGELPVQAHGLGDGVTTLPYIDQPEILADLFRAVDFVFSAALDETFGQTLVEGAMSGAIPVALGGGGVAEIMEALGGGFWHDIAGGEAAALSAAAAFMSASAGEEGALRARQLFVAMSARQQYSITALARRLHGALFGAGIIPSGGAGMILRPDATPPRPEVVPRWAPAARRQETEAQRARIEELEAEIKRLKLHLGDADRLKQLYKRLATGILEELRHADPRVASLFEDMAGDIYHERLGDDDPRLYALFDAMAEVKRQLVEHRAIDRAAE